MSSVFNYAPIDFDSYLQQEHDAEYRSEYVDGKVYAMAGASKTHNTIAVSHIYRRVRKEVGLT